MAILDTLLTLAGGGALAEGLRYMRARATTHAGEHAETERTGRHTLTVSAAHVDALMHRVERLERQRDESLSEIADLRVQCAWTEGELSALRAELEDTRQDLFAAVERARAAEERASALAAQVEELRSHPLSNPPVASGD